MYCNTAFGQMQNIVIDSLYGPSEPSIAIDPKNPMHMVAGSNLMNYYVSTDGGYHWNNDSLVSSYGVFGDPVIISDTTGAFLYFHLSNNPNIHAWPMWADRIVCQRMDDITTGGWTNGGFTGFVDTPAMSDKPGIAIDRESNTIYVTWTRFDQYGSSSSADSSNIFFSKSQDQGNTWSTPLRINREAGNCTDDDPTVEGATPCVGPHGEIFVAWASLNELMFDRSYDGGATWLTNDIRVAAVPGGWNYDIPGLNRCNGLPFTACDISTGPFRGNIYINWTDQLAGIDNTDVWICRSSDSGNTWSAPIRVNDDAGIAQQFFSSMTVDPATGYVYVVFYDRREHMPPSDTLTDVYLAVSKDGGASFHNHKISEKPFKPDPLSFFGDYTYISAFNGVVRPIWGMNNHTATVFQRRIMTAIIDSTITGTSVNYIRPAQNNLTIYPNPVKDKTILSYELSSAGYTSIYITDVSGRKIATIENGWQEQGRHSTGFSALHNDLSPGLYFVVLKNNASVLTQKMVVGR